MFYRNKVYIVDNVKTINDTYSLTIRAEDFSNYGQEVFKSVSLKSENTRRKHILQKQSSQFLKIIYFDFCNFSMFLQRSRQFN